MFGQNPVRKQDLGSPQRLWIQEVFGTIQGEGPFNGMPAVFVRLAGCNLKCFWCDTDFESSNWSPSLQELTSRIEEEFLEMGRQEFPLVVLTGGEPLRQNILWLIEELVNSDIHVQIETNGIVWINGLEKFIEDGTVTLVCSPKTGKVHQKVREYCCDWKYIVDELSASPEDGLPLASTQVEGKSVKIARSASDVEPFYGYHTIWVQPLDMDHVDKRLTKRNMTHAAEVAKKYGYRLCLQQHKIVGLP